MHDPNQPQPPSPGWEPQAPGTTPAGYPPPQAPTPQGQPGHSGQPGQGWPGQLPQQPLAHGGGGPNPAGFVPDAITAQLAGRPATVTALALLIGAGALLLMGFLRMVNADGDFYGFADRGLLVFTVAEPSGATLLVSVAVGLLALSSEENKLRTMALLGSMIGAAALTLFGVLGALFALGADSADGVETLGLFVLLLAGAVLAAATALWAVTLSKRTR